MKSKLNNLDNSMKFTKKAEIKSYSSNLYEMIARGKSDSLSSFSYAPFNSNDVLTVEYTNKNIYFLLKSGILICPKSENSNSYKKNNNDIKTQGIPIHIKLPTVVLDIVCGKDHCLAKGKNNKIYSWGSNNFGQLGIVGFPMNPTSEKGDPTEITGLNNFGISQIFARNNSSLAISEDLKLYGWGCNENGQFHKFERNESVRKIATPTQIFSEQKFDQDLTLFFDKEVKKIHFAEIERPAKSLLEILEVNRNKHLYSKEHELKEEITKLKVKQNQFINLRSTVEDYENLIKDIQNLIVKYEDKINNLGLKNKKEFNIDNNEENINFYDTKIQFLLEKEKTMQNIVSKLDTNINKSKIKLKSNNISNENNDDRLFNIQDFISRVNTELQFQKHSNLNDHLRHQDEEKQKSNQIKHLKENIKVFEKAKEATLNKIDKMFSISSIKDINLAMEKIKSETPIIEVNSLKNINLEDNESLSYILDKYMSKLETLEEKFEHINIETRNPTILKLNQMLTQNLTLQKENNGLMNEILKYSGILYNSSLNKIIKNQSVKINQNKANKINLFKNSYKDTIDNNSDSQEDEDLREICSDESLNY